MMKVKITLAFLIAAIGIALSLLPTAEARIVYFGSETETITLVYGGATLLRFPMEVKTISQARHFEIGPANPDQPNYALLSIRPRFLSGSSEVVFILSDGTVIKTKLVVVSQAQPEKTDAIYDFKSKDTLLSRDQESGSQGAGSNLNEMELMKAMIRGDEVSGYEVRNLIRSVSPGIKGVEIKLVRLYTGSLFNGYVFEIGNVTPKQKLFINVQNLMLGEPNVAILSAVDQPVIEPKGKDGSKTYLRVVAKATSLYNQLMLPVEVVERKLQ